MLVLSRKIRETIVIDGCITVKVLQIKGNTIRLGIEAPKEMSIRRGELLEERVLELAPARENDEIGPPLAASTEAPPIISYTCAAS